MTTSTSLTSPIETKQGFTIEGLAEFKAQLRALVDNGKLANIVTLIARHGEIVHHDAYGVMNVSATPPVPVKPDSIFRIASMTKPITSAAMMMLWEDGKWALEDPVSKFVPEFEGLQVRQEDGELVPQVESMTMKHLMSHSAGFGAREEYPDLRGGDLQDMIDFLAKQPLSFQPGQGWRYGPSVDIQGYIIQRLTGIPLDEFLEQHIFAPLGMVDTGYLLPESKAERIVSNHRIEKDGKLVGVDLQGTYNASKPKFLGGGGGLMLSTVKDYWRFCQMILNGGEFEGRCYLKPRTVEMMHTNALESGVTLNFFRHNINGLGFGLGYAIVQDPVIAKTSRAIHSFFWSGLYGTWFWIDPVNDTIVIGFINTVGGSSPAGALVVRELSARLVYNAMNQPSNS